jgi:hypothetical protein
MTVLTPIEQFVHDVVDDYPLLQAFGVTCRPTDESISIYADDMYSEGKFSCMTATYNRVNEDNYKYAPKEYRTLYPLVHDNIIHKVETLVVSQSNLWTGFSLGISTNLSKGIRTVSISIPNEMFHTYTIPFPKEALLELDTFLTNKVASLMLNIKEVLDADSDYELNINSSDLPTNLSNLLPNFGIKFYFKEAALLVTSSVDLTLLHNLGKLINDDLHTRVSYYGFGGKISD